jgi:hypothetical protein
MYKTPQYLVAIVMPNPAADHTDFEQYATTSDLLDHVENFGMDQYNVGSLLCVKYHGRYFITTYYMMAARRNAEFDAAKNGFPFYADEDDQPFKVGLLARLYRAIIA